ncbi:PepSY-associated TM helix domain-containing protein [Tsuneonella suprasediminis]|uniref:PepSY-associated TM helix domain-containing protein n=1 Tax=Tsuneonella suprasediminis TaxID=2306996 RepID=UPI001F0B7227|nr:PepSY-associated TM helix domain-containing protein [Tsuneonella suprasediminis]
MRWGKGQRSWLDAHNVTAVVALPYHAMITYTGLITLAVMYMPWPILANYGQSAAFEEDAYGALPTSEASGRPIVLAPIDPMVDAATRQWAGTPPRTLVIRHPCDAAATVMLTRARTNRLNALGTSITYSGASGDKLSQSPSPGAAATTAGVLLGLHLGAFADPLMRWTFFVLGLTGSAMVATGLSLWTVKRSSRSSWGLWLVERLNIGAVACLPAGMAAYLLANRLIPTEIPNRAGLEVDTMFWVWFGLAIATLARPVRRAWIETLAIAAFLFAAAPLVSIVMTDRGLIQSLSSGDWLFASFDCALLAIAGLLSFTAWRIWRSSE